MSNRYVLGTGTTSTTHTWDPVRQKWVLHPSTTTVPYTNPYKNITIDDWDVCGTAAPDPQDLLVEAAILQAARDAARGKPLTADESKAVGMALLRLHGQLSRSRKKLKNLLETLEHYVTKDR